MRIRTDRALPRPSRSGFTLIELMIVVVIIGILVAIALPRFGSAATAAKQHEAHLILKQIYTLQGAYFNRHGGYAASLTDLVPQGWQSPEPLRHYQAPTISGGGAGSTTFTACMLGAQADIINRSIDQDGIFGTC